LPPAAAGKKNKHSLIHSFTDSFVHYLLGIAQRSERASTLMTENKSLLLECDNFIRHQLAVHNPDGQFTGEYNCVICLTETDTKVRHPTAWSCPEIRKLRSSASSSSSSSLSSAATSSSLTFCYSCYDPCHQLGQCPCKLIEMPRGCCYGCLFPMVGCSTHRKSQIDPTKGGFGKKCLARDIVASLVWFHYRKGMLSPAHLLQPAMMRLRTARPDSFAGDSRAFARWLQQETTTGANGITNVIALFHDLIKPSMHAH
jgi:hypothetical protein